MLTHVIYDEETGEIVQTHIEYDVEEDRVTKGDDEEVLSNVEPDTDRDNLNVAQVDLPGRPSTTERDLEIDVDAGRLKEKD